MWCGWCCCLCSSRAAARNACGCSKCSGISTTVISCSICARLYCAIAVPCPRAAAASSAAAAAPSAAAADASVSTDGRAAGGSAWQLPPGNARDAAAAREALHEKLLPLAVGLYRAERLPAALQQYKAAVGEEVKAGVRDAVQQVLPVLLAACGEQQHAGQAGSETQLADQLQVGGTMAPAGNCCCCCTAASLEGVGSADDVTCQQQNSGGIIAANCWLRC